MTWLAGAIGELIEGTGVREAGACAPALGSQRAPSGAQSAADVEGDLVNTVQLVGRIGSKFIEERYPRDGEEDLLKVRFLLKVKKPIKVAEGEIPRPEWVRIEVWGPVAASLIAWNRKGSRIGITGRMRGDLYQPEGAAFPEIRMAVVAERIDFLSDPPRLRTRAGNVFS